MTARHYHCFAQHRQRGFTLVEAMLTTVIIGVGFVSMLALFGACTNQNSAAAHMTAAMLLAENIQETMAGLPLTDPAYGRTYFGPEPGQTLGAFDDVDDFDAHTFNPPIDSTRQPIAAMSEYAQAVSVWPVYPNKLSANSDMSSPDLSQTTYTGSARVMVRVMHRSSATSAFVEVYRASWIRVAN